MRSRAAPPSAAAVTEPEAGSVPLGEREQARQKPVQTVGPEDQQGGQPAAPPKDKKGGGGKGECLQGCCLGVSPSFRFPSLFPRPLLSTASAAGAQPARKDARAGWGAR